MSISEKLTTIRNTLRAIRQAIINKGQTPSGDITTYPDAIGNISSGDTAYIPRVFTNGNLRAPVESFTFTLPSDIFKIGVYCFYYALYDCDGLTSVDWSNNDITAIYSNGLAYAFSRCGNLTSIALNAYRLYNYSLFRVCDSCSNLTTVDLHGVNIVDSYGLGYAFYNCKKLTSVDLSGVGLIEGNAFLSAFEECKSLKSVSFPALNTKSFGSDTNHFSYMLSGVTDCTVHFPSNLESVIGTWSDVTKGFNGTNTTVLFDLPETF